MKKVVEWIRRIEKYFLALLVLSISFFSIGQILLRRFARVPLWIDPCINILVVWTAFIAAGVVTYEASHIKIDIVGRFVKGVWKKVVYGFISLFGSLASSLFMVLFVVYLTVIEYLSKVSTQGNDALIHTLFLAVIPWGFLVMAVRMINMMCADFHSVAVLAGKKPDSSLFKMIFVVFNAIFMIATVIFYLNKGNVQCLILSICSLLLTVIFAVMQFIKKSSKLTPVISMICGLVILALFVFQMIEIIDVNYQAKVTRELFDITDAKLNAMYILPTLSFFFGWLSLVVPFGEYLRDIYPEIEEVVVEEDAK